MEGVVVRLIVQPGVQWAGHLDPEPDLLIYCSDGILTASQVLLAAASLWLKQLLFDISEYDDNRIKTLLIPFVTTKQMKQVLDLICGGNVVLKEGDISSLVEISSLLGCIGDMLKEPVDPSIQLENQKDDRSNPEQILGLSMEMKLKSDISVQSVLDKIFQIQRERMTRMELEEEEEEEEDNQSIEEKVTVKREKIVEDPADSDDFVVSDDEFDDSDYERRGYTYKKRKRIKFDLEEFEEALIELGESTATREGAAVSCGLCDKSISVPEDSRVKIRIKFFKKHHYNKCLKKRTGGDSEGEDDNSHGEDSLEEVYNQHVKMKEEDNFKTAQGRRKADVPPIETIRSFLEALGGATIVNKGHQIKCGLCHNKLRVNIGRTIMGNIRYFERTHLLRCPVRIAKGGKPTELISENFLPGRTPVSRVLNNIRVFDAERAEVVTQLIMGEPEFRRNPGRPRKDEEVLETKGKREYYMSKRKQCIHATTTCFSCILSFESGPEAEDHFKTEHPNLLNPFYCLACQEYFKSHDEVMDHLDTDHNYKLNYSCNFCDAEEFISQSRLNRHISEEHPEEEVLFSCPMCTKGFSSFHALKCHQKTHTNIEPEMMVDPKMMLASMEEAFTCRFCGISIMYGKHLDQHIREAHQAQLEVGENAFMCQLCPQPNVVFDEFYHFETHLRNHGITIDHICRYCRSINLNRNKFIEHFKEQHPGEPPYECPRFGCEKTFLKKQKLHDHIVLHRVKEGDISEDMKKICVECGKVFYVRKKLEQHIRLVHGGEGLPSSMLWNASKDKKHQCHLCIQTFSSNSLLQGHLRKHENNPCFMCDHCGKGFYRKDRLAVHTRSVHLGMKNFSCELCEKKFIDSYKLRRHMKTHTSGRGAAAAQTVAIVTAPAAVSYETIGDASAIIRKLDPDAEPVQQHHVTIQQISGSPTILQVTTQPHHIAKRTTIQNFLKFEEEEVVEEQTPVDFTQQSEPKIHTQYIINTQLYQT